MACSLCSQAFNTRRHPVCQSCAQVAIYPLRVQQALALLEREKVHNHVEAVLRPGNDGVIAALSEDTDLESITAETQRQRLVQAKAEQERSNERIRSVTEKAAELRSKIEQYKQYLTHQAERGVKRQKMLEQARHQLILERARLIEPLTTSIHKTEQRLERAANRTAEARAYLCNQAALLLGLKKLPTTNAQTTSQYLLAGLPIPNLRYLCRTLGQNEPKDAPNDQKDYFEGTTQPYERITASLEHVSRLVSLCCHYLSIRLPAELELPRSRMTKTTILPEKSSYRLTDNEASPSLRTSATVLSRSHSEREPSLTRLRALHLDRAPAQLFRDDPKAFRLFVESTMLLTWDVAWLCRSQGLDHINTFEDICAIGRNLHALLLHPAGPNPRHPPPAHNASPSRPGPVARRSTGHTDRVRVRLGVFSHHSAHHNVLGASGQEFLAGWRFLSPSATTRLIDKLANHFLTEMSQQEWDIVDDHEWDNERDDEQAVLVGGHARSLTGKA